MTYWVRLVSLLVTDAVLINLAVYGALLLRFEGHIEPGYLANYFSLIPLVTVVTLLFLFATRLYHRIWEYASIGEMLAVVQATTCSMAAIVLVIYFFGLPKLPRSVYILSWMLMNIFIGASRIWWRVFRDYWLKETMRDARRVLIVGAGDAGALLSREIRNNPQLKLRPVGFIDDDRKKQRRMLHGIPVLGARQNIPRAVADFQVDEIIIAMPSVSGRETREIIDICKKTPARVRILPPADQYINGGSLLARLREVEMEDLLRREPVEIDLDAIAGYLSGKTVLVTGAGGSIGSELCRQAARFAPDRLVLVDNSENNLFEIDIELRAEYPDITISAELADVRDKEKVERLFQKYRPAVVFHAAAYKHVPMMELHPAEALRNNVLGTKNVAEAADRYGAGTFILISTDKAVNPTSVMGATKRIAEMVIQSIARDSSTRFAAVRFGNVLGSRGSVVPLFKKQIANGGPVTVTHPDMRRYFMTIPEAVQLVIQAGAMTKGGEIFVLDMGEPVKIVDLAEDLIRLSGLRPGEDIEITFTGIRPGEKLYEELMTPEEGMDATTHERIWIAHADGLDTEKVENVLLTRLERGDRLTKSDILTMLGEVVPEYQQRKLNMG
ncbi:MAG: polysaccharide biosynthesis protein [Syntrophomonadaceae bacterium]|nr:polysaccharide biosynthesis protein [Syntrophomonadaceae bacterium]